MDEHKRLIVSTSPSTPVGLTFVHLSTVGTLTAEEAADPSVLISTHEDAVEVPLDAPPGVLVHWGDGGAGHHDENQETSNTTKIADKVERHGSILIALIASLCVIAAGLLGYVCLRWRCFIFPAKSGGKVGPMHATELGDVKTGTEKPLPGR